MKSVLQDWVMSLGLRHQGVLLTAIRGCDTAPKDDPSKLLSRCIRNEILNAHCGDSKKSVSFIEHCELEELTNRMNAFAKNLDHYPHHYIMHLIHAVEIIGYKKPNSAEWKVFYFALVRGCHMAVETEQELDRRLNADESAFGASQKVRLYDTEKV